MLVAAGNPASYADQVEVLSDALAGSTGLEVEVSVVNDYAPVLAGMCERTVHIGMLDAFAYLSASERGCAIPALVAERGGEISVEGQLIANTQSLVTNVESFRGRRFCRPEAGSAYGWIVPGLMLYSRGIDPLNELNAVIDSGDDEGVVQDVHDRECDVGATLLGAEETVDDLEEPGRITFVEALPPIPNEVIAFSNVIDGPTREASVAAFEEAESDLLDVMSADGLQAIRSDDFNDLRNLFNTAGIDVVALGR